MMYINNKVQKIIQQSEKTTHPIYRSVTTSRGIKKLIHIEKTLINPRGNIAFQNKSTPIQSYFPITKSNIPIYQTPFTNLSSFNIKDNSLFHPLRHQQNIWTPSRLKKYYPLYLTTSEITQSTYHPPPVIIDNHEQQMILNHDKSSLHHYSSDYSSTISMNKQQDSSDIELRPAKLINQYIWKENN